MSEFLGIEDYSEAQINQGSAQRIMLIAAKFRKEVTSTVIWLMNFALRVQCFKVTPYERDDQLFLNFDQILPVKDAQEYAISMASKSQEENITQENLKERHHKRLDFWSAFLNQSNDRNNLFSNISPAKDNWLGIGIGMSGVNLNMVASRTYGRAEIYMNRGSKDENKRCFDFFADQKEKIESEFGGSLIWERMDENVSCRIKSQLDGVSMYDKDDWQKMIEYMVDVAERMEKAFRGPVRQLNKLTKQKN